MVRSNAGSDCDFEVFGFGETFSGKVSGVEATERMLIVGRFKLPGCQSSATERATTIEEGLPHGVVMITSASTNSWSNLEFSPSLSDVVTNVWPCSSSHFRIPSSFSVVPRSSGTSLACSCPYSLKLDAES